MMPLACRPKQALPWLAPLVVAAGALGLLSACRTESPVKEAPATQTGAELPHLPLAQTVTTVRDGIWQGGPEPLSGKLRVGISTYFRQRPMRPQAGAVFEVDLRFEEVSADHVQVQLQPGDGARLAVAGAQSAWRLSKDQMSQITVKMTAPQGQSYLHAMLAVGGRQVARSFLIETQSTQP